MSMINKDFRQHVAPRSMVSLKFSKKETILNSTLFDYCINSCKKVEKLEFNDIELDLPTVNKMIALLDNPVNMRFLTRVNQLILNNVKFEGTSDVQKDFVVSKLMQIIGKFQNLNNLEFSSVNRFPQIVKCLLQFKEIRFLNKIKVFKINACEIQEEHLDNVYAEIEGVILRFENVEELQLRGLRIGDHLQEFIKSIKRPQIKSLDFELNGIEPESVLYLNYILNFESLVSLNISSNWIGLIGLERIKDNFSAFQQLRILKIGNNKLFRDENHRTECLCEMLFVVHKTLEELYLHENSMRNEDLITLSPVLTKIPNLKYLELSRNLIEGQGMRYFLDEYIKNSAMNNMNLQTLILTSNQLRDDGVSDVLDRIHQILNLKIVNLTANRVTEFFTPILVKFIKTFDEKRQLSIEFKKQDIKKRDTQEQFKQRVNDTLREKDQSGQFKIKAALMISM